MNKEQLFSLLSANFKLLPTEGQEVVMKHLAAFLLSDKPFPLYLLKGFAGTGKTTLVSTLVKTLPSLKMGYVLMAPTGRAAKVLQNYSAHYAHTIHRKIYIRQPKSDGSIRLVVAPNKHKNTLFIVDEASMIGDNSQDQSLFTAHSLLDDLMAYVYDGENCRLLLIGDHAQLPPVGSDLSPALNLQYLKTTYTLTAASYELTEVMRQALESGILANATWLREKLYQNNFELPIVNCNGFKDVMKVSSFDFEELLHDSFAGKVFGKAVIICRSNRRANNYNNAVRSRILGFDEQLNGGDLLMVVKNNYYWISEPQGKDRSEQGLSFIANGDMITINRIIQFEQMYGFNFADADISFLDYPDQPAMQVKLLLDTLMIDGPALNHSDHKKLADAVEEDYLEITNLKLRRQKLRSNPYMNALQVKFGYALTCHKTQGGQWEQVFIDGSNIQPEKIDAGYLRWLYTAVTRATQKLMLVNFHDPFIE
jgi:exodeoxyribonuclease V